jgi:hypothetical protein
MSATVALSGTTSTSTSTSTGTPTQTVTTTQTVTVPVLPPVLSHVSQSHTTWRAGSKLAAAARRSRPVGTVFSYQLNETATATFSFVQKLAGRVVKGRCVAATSANARDRACARRRAQGTLSEGGRSGRNRVSFQGRLSTSRRLPTGAYSVSLQARNASGLTSAPRSLTFTIAK